MNVHRRCKVTGIILFIFCSIVVGKPSLANEADVCVNVPQSQKPDCQKAYDLLTQQPTYPQPDLTVHVTISGDKWRFEYQLPPAPDGTVRASYCSSLSTLTLPQGKHVQLLVTADDQIYEWEIPAFAVKVAAIPGRVAEVNITASDTGVFSGLGNANGHFQTPAIHIVEPEAFTVWENETRQKPCPVK